jgi:hypothetical protein
VNQINPLSDKIRRLELLKDVTKSQRK